MATSVASVVTRTVTDFTKTVTKTAGATASSANRAAPQGGILEGADPSKYDPKNPIILFIIQASIIIIFCRILHWPLSKIRQPRVIAEVIGGILLGPSVMGRIPGFTEHIFPQASMSNLNLAANIGLILFLFLVGLEVNLKLFLGNWRVALSVGFAGIALPFGLGCGIAYGLYQRFREDAGLQPISFGVYMLFIGIAMAITAFPVLCRILTELKLLSTPVGVIVLSAGVGNDVVGWILLALCVALVNAGTGLTALWVLLTCVGWALFLVYIIRPGFMWIVRRSGSLQNGPTQTVVGITILLVLASAFFTGIIGVHPIFGAFIVGLLCPHDGGFAIKLAEKIEDLVSVLFLPLYFALSGLSTNLALLNTGITWAYVIGVIAVAFFGKVIGGTLAARCCRLVWRESLTIGVLMSCKGLVELIVLNIGYSAKILSQRTFTIFVVMALITTFATTPLVAWLYPPSYQRKLEAWKRGEIDWDGNPLHPHEGPGFEKLRSNQVHRILVYLRLESLPGLLTLTSLLGNDISATPVTPKVHRLKINAANTAPLAKTPQPEIASEQSVAIHGLRLLELTERASTVMKVSEMDEFAIRDPCVNVFRTVSQLNNVAVSGNVSIVPESTYADTLLTQASNLSSDMVLIPWSESGLLSEQSSPLSDYQETNRSTSSPQCHFVTTALDQATCHTAILVNRGLGRSPAGNESRKLRKTVSGLSLQSSGHYDQSAAPANDRSHHIYMPFFGRADDRVALRFALQIAQRPNVTATIVYFEDSSPIHSDENSVSGAAPSTDLTGTAAAASATGRTASTISKLGFHNNSVSVTSQPTRSSSISTFFNSVRNTLPEALASRVVFETVTSPDPAAEAAHRAAEEVGLAPRNAGDLIILGRNSTPEHAHQLDHHHHAPPATVDPARRLCLGALADTLCQRNLKASICVVQAKE
ncbi:hypothetical protein L228DRAFT_219037 [Xylona heveae TC161]|uniref:Cation/H+ exchanger transmembrane domain-containing protein n=1 Tax=Xylona heveae (strain CBS 132557 / TC161) TaxID=1328760 RepID=A0A161TF22_XYLHT|nr:hypothetical protein L228DRAFT_219037 [Xylona heveae TC161]KZF24577.1 hypothetical protein L228DRAFT_219037 [Xylona heveae TC161]